MENQYADMPQDVQKALQEHGGTAHNHSGIWEVTFPPETKVNECLLWTSQLTKRTEYMLYSLPGGDNNMFVEAKEGYRSLHLLTPEMQEKYALSYPLDTQGYPEISMRDGVKEILVPGLRREGDNAIFLDGFGNGRPGFGPIFVLFTYHRSGQREIYLIPPSEKDDFSKRYAHLQELMPAKVEPGKIRIVMAALDYHLKDAYGIDWEQELEEIADGR
jgi:hypothetical protein